LSEFLFDSITLLNEYILGSKKMESEMSLRNVLIFVFLNIWNLGINRIKAQSLMNKKVDPGCPEPTLTKKTYT